jgi:hypothetical protein
LRYVASVSRSKWLPVLFAATVTACGETWYVAPLHAPPHVLQPRPLEEVDVITVRPPDQPFVEVAIIGSDSGLKRVRWHAAQLGCDAVYLLAPMSSRHTTTTRATCLAYGEAW